MTTIRLRTKLVLSLIFTTAVLTGASLLIVQNYLRKHAKREMNDQLISSLETFGQYAQQRQKMLSQSASVSADAPTIRALMTTKDELTIQDSAADFWKLTESDLFVLADPAGKVMALHPSTGGLERSVVRTLLAQSLQQQQFQNWWFAGGRLYEVFLKPIYRGTPEDNALVGVLAAGFAVDERFAATVQRITSSDVAFHYGKTVVSSSLPVSQQQELSTRENPLADTAPLAIKEIPLVGETFVAASVALPPEGDQPVTLTVLRSYDAATLFLRNVNRLLLAIGLIALIAGAGLMFVISDRLTRPLARLVSGVVALQKGDFSYPLQAPTHDEVGELTVAFDTMRKSLKESQQQLLHAERLATIGRMASTISHDLRHPLTTIVAYAELLAESELDDDEKRDMYRQIRLSVNNMTELIASLLEFSKAQQALQLTYGDCAETLQNTLRTVKLQPTFRQIQLTLRCEGPTHGWFDFAKLDRAFNNLLRNACEAVDPDSGRVRVVAVGSSNRVEISVSDNGSGIPEEIQHEIFQPFVTFGKSDGTGLGLAVVQKIVRDHGGEVAVESTGSHGTTFKLTLPVVPDTRTAALS
jgi:signal transduction histidine kinase